MPKRDVDDMDYTQDSEVDEKGEMKVDEDGELLQGKRIYPKTKVGSTRWMLLIFQDIHQDSIC